MLRRLVHAIAVLVALSAANAAAADLSLINAVRHGNAEVMRQLIADGVDVGLKQGDGSTALHWAARRDDLDAAAALLRAGANANSANEDAATPLYLACLNRSDAMVKLLLEAGADANAALLNGETALMTCAHTGNAMAVKALLARGAKVDAREAGHKQTALMWAAAQGHSEVVGLLLDAGAYFRARSTPYVQTVVGEETQRAGREKLNYDVIRGGSTALLFAARSGDVESTRLLLDAGADPDDALPDGTSALVLAVHSGHGEVSKLLLERGADPNAFGAGYGALHAAVLRSNADVVRALLEKGADPNRRMTRGTPMRRQTTDYNLPATLIGSTPYLLAARFAEAGCMRALAEGGADTAMTMPDGTTALMAAAGVGMRPGRNRRGIAPIDVGGTPETEGQILEAVKAALERDGDVNRTDEEGNAAIHGAAANRYDSVIAFLAEHGADVNLKNSRGQTPLAMLSRRGGRRTAASADDPEGPETSSTGELLLRLGAVE